MTDIADAFIRLLPRADGFRADSDKQLAAETRDLNVSVPLKPDAKGFRSDADAKLAVEDRGLSAKVSLNTDNRTTRKAALDAATLFRKTLSDAGSSGGGGGGAASSFGNLSGAFSALPIQGQVAIAGAALASLPFIAQAAAGGIVAALGGALTGVAILGAVKTKAVQDSFASLAKTANADLTTIGKPFVPVLTKLATTAGQVLGTLTGPLQKFASTVAGPFKTFSDALLRAFAQPAVKQSIQAVAKAFGDILKALTPGLAGDVSDIAIGITNVARSVSENPHAIADFVSDLFKIAGGALDIISSLTRVANWVEHNWNWVKWIVAPVIVAIAEVISHWGTLTRFFTQTVPTAFDIFRETIKLIWLKMLVDVDKFALGVTTTMGHLPGPLGAPFRAASASIRKSLAGTEQDVRNTVGKIQADWDKLHGKTVKFGFQFQVPGALNPAGGGAGLGHKTTISGGYAVGTGGARPGWAWVGERGPELVRMLGGETVLSNPQSMKAVRGYAMGTQVTDSFTPPVGVFLREFNTAFARESAAIVAALRQFAPSSGGGGAEQGDTGARTGSAAVAQAYARSQLGRFGWGPDQMPPLISLWNQESGWSAYAVNSSSGAAGIAQSLGHGHVTLGDYVGQINWGLGYIKGRYGSPAGAWAHEVANNWYAAGTLGGEPRKYDSGGWMPPGLSLSYNGTGAWERLDRRKGGQVVNVMPIQNQYVTDRTDAELVSQRVSWAFTQGGY